MIDLTVKLSKADRTLEKHLSGWQVLHPYLMKQPVDEPTLNELRKLLTIEIQGQCREQIVKRLVGRIRSIRHVLEEQHLYRLMDGKMVMAEPRTKNKKRKPKKKVITSIDELPSEMALGS